MYRRQLIKYSVLFLANSLMSKNAFSMYSHPQNQFFFPDESHPHVRTWMAFVANDWVWSRKQVPQVKKDLALLANTIAKYEPVSVLINQSDIDEAKQLLDIDSSNFEIKIYPCAIDDLWLRDTGASFVRNVMGEKFAIDFNFNGWGEKQEYINDKFIAQYMAKASKVELFQSRLVLEGGGFEVDGAGTAIMTKSCILNDNRNPGWSQLEVEDELKSLLGLKKIIWLEGIKGKDITDGHIDFYARFIKPGEVIVSRENYRDSFDYDVTRENIDVLKNSVDANNNSLTLHIIDTPSKFNERFGVNDFAAGYIGYYVCNGAIIAQKFGDIKADKKAYSLLKKVFPDRVIEQISIDGIASGGGSIHCATQQEPRF